MSAMVALSGMKRVICFISIILGGGGLYLVQLAFQKWSIEYIPSNTINGWSRDLDRNISHYVPLLESDSKWIDAFFLSRPSLPQKPLEVVFFIVSSPSNLRERQSVRETWGAHAKDLQMPLVFVLGRSDSVPQNVVSKEQKTYEDLLLIDVKDSYENLTLKTTAILSFVHHFKLDTRFVVKADDDVYINVALYATELLKFPRTANNFFICHLIQLSQVLRSSFQGHEDMKWVVPHWMYQPNFFWPYCAGSIYAFHKAMTSELLRKIVDTPLIVVEDSYLTGIVRSQTDFGISHMTQAKPDGATVCHKPEYQRILVRSSVANLEQIQDRVERTIVTWRMWAYCKFNYV